MLYEENRTNATIVKSPTPNTWNCSSNKQNKNTTICATMLVPPSTRHSGVLRLPYEVDLFDMRGSNPTTVTAVFHSSRAAKAVMKTMLIVTRRAKEREGLLGLLELEIIIFPSSGGSTEEVTCKVAIPRDWPPNMLLAMVSKSVAKNRLLCLEKVEINHNQFTTINAIHTLFGANFESLHKYLLKTSAYIDVDGGNFTSISYK